MILEPKKLSLSLFPLFPHLFARKWLDQSLFCAIRVASSAYLRLLIFLLAILIPACVSYTGLTYSFSYLEPVSCSMSGSNCYFLTCIQISQEAWQVVWYSHLFQNFPQFLVIHKVKGFGIVNKAEIDVFLELSCFIDDPADVGNLISGSSAFCKTSLNIWKFKVHLLLKPGLENFAHYLTSLWDECSCAVVWAFFGIAFFWDFCGINCL